MNTSSTVRISTALMSRIVFCFLIAVMTHPEFAFAQQNREVAVTAVSASPRPQDPATAGWPRHFQYDDADKPISVLAWGSPRTLPTEHGPRRAVALYFVADGDQVRVYMPQTQDLSLVLRSAEIKWGIQSRATENPPLDPASVDIQTARALVWNEVTEVWDHDQDGLLNFVDINQTFEGHRSVYSGSSSLPRQILCSPCDQEAYLAGECTAESTDRNGPILLGFPSPTLRTAYGTSRRFHGGLSGGMGFVPSSPSAADEGLPADCLTTGFDVCAGMGYVDCNNNHVKDWCELVFGIASDCNHNNIIDACENDCNGNGIADECEFVSDCNANCQEDADEIAAGISPDCNLNGLPDSCDGDCNNNGVPDDCDVDPADPDGDGVVLSDCNHDGRPDLTTETPGGLCAADCNGNGIPDACDVDPSDPDGDGAVWADCNGNGQPDAVGCEWQDCNNNGIPDDCDVDPMDPDGDGMVFPDCDGDLLPDLLNGQCESDCNGNGAVDECDVLGGFSQDCNGNLVPDECEIAFGSDCNQNGIPDDCDVALGTSRDCDSDTEGNGVPDECEADCDGNGEADTCDVQWPHRDCNADGIPDACQPDCNSNGIADVCELDCNGNGYHDSCDLASGESQDMDGNGVPDECDEDCDSNGIPDSIQGCQVDLVFVVDTSESMYDDMGALCESMDRLSQAASSCSTLDLQYRIYGIIEDVECTNMIAHGNVCDDVNCTVPRHADGTPPACSEELDQYESWAPAVSIIAADSENPWTTVWRPQSDKIIIPLTDQGPCQGDPCELTGSDEAAILQAIELANAHDIVVSPIIGSPYEFGEPSDFECVNILADLLANQTSGLVLHMDEYESEEEFLNAMGYSISSIIQRSCASDQNLDCILDGCE